MLYLITYIHTLILIKHKIINIIKSELILNISVGTIRIEYLQLLFLKKIKPKFILYILIRTIVIYIISY